MAQLVLLLLFSQGPTRSSWDAISHPHYADTSFLYIVPTLATGASNNTFGLAVFLLKSTPAESSIFLRLLCLVLGTLWKKSDAILKALEDIHYLENAVSKQGKSNIKTFDLLHSHYSFWSSTKGLHWKIWKMLCHSQMPRLKHFLSVAILTSFPNKDCTLSHLGAHQQS